MTDDARRKVAVHLAERGWNQSDLVEATGINKNTISDFLTGRTASPSRRTLAKVEAALGLTPGMLAAAGEEREPAASADRVRENDPLLREATDEELLVELGYRMVQLRRDAKLAHYVDSRTPTELVLEASTRDARLRDLKRQRMLEDAQPVDRAVDDRDPE